MIVPLRPWRSKSGNTVALWKRLTGGIQSSKTYIYTETPDPKALIY